jgi:hypothetical protein
LRSSTTSSNTLLRMLYLTNDLYVGHEHLLLPADGDWHY